ncbi:MAG: alpha/beta hydrolase [Acidobacteriaceae bacterium]|nr:alpha/beta hydrolase [Acidobacteriaceae bacterium]
MASMLNRLSRSALHLASASVIAFAACTASAQTLPLWPHGTPEPPQTKEAESSVDGTSPLYPGINVTRVSNVTVPTLALYPVPAGIKPTGSAVVVFPGGGYQRLAYTHEGVLPCQWFNQLGVFCAVAKYRVPWPQRYHDNLAPLEDAQQAVRIVRSHAAEWHIDPHHIGVMGFSAGGHLSADLSMHYDNDHVLSTPAAKDVLATITARPDFVILGYPAYLAVDPDQHTVDPNMVPTKDVAPTFIAAAENDKSYGNNSPVYYRALKDAGVSASLVIFADGGHGFGLSPTGVTASAFPTLLKDWLVFQKIIPAPSH